jgi:thiamine kinase-like enzyme
VTPSSEALGLDQESIDARLDALACLGGRPRTVEELPGGLTNLNLKVTAPGGTFVVRVSRGGEHLLGIDRDAEQHNTHAAATAGVAAPVVEYRPDLGVLVIEYIAGITFSNDSFAVPGTLERVADAARSLHAGPRFVGDFDMFSRQKGYLAVVREHALWVPDGYESLDEQFQQAGRALAVRRDRSVPCNNDLLAANFVDDGERLWLIDYEYSGNNDACFELGNIAAECALDTDQLDALVTAYYRQPSRARTARARLQALVSPYGWSLWGAIQAARSPLDFDFRSWTQERFEKAAAGFTSDGFGLLLEEARRDD